MTAETRDLWRTLAIVLILLLAALFVAIDAHEAGAQAGQQVTPVLDWSPTRVATDTAPRPLYTIIPPRPTLTPRPYTPTPPPAGDQLVTVHVEERCTTGSPARCWIANLTTAPISPRPLPPGIVAIYYQVQTYARTDATGKLVYLRMRIE